MINFCKPFLTAIAKKYFHEFSCLWETKQYDNAHKQSTV